MTKTCGAEDVKKFYFTDDSWWDSPGCSCCPDTLVEAYNSEDIDPSLGTAHCIFDCYVRAIITTLLRRNHSCYFDPEALYLMEVSEIDALCKAMEIEVEVHG